MTSVIKVNQVNYFSNWQNIFKISFGIVFFAFNFWILFHLQNYIPEDMMDYWFKLFISYMAMVTFVYGNANIRNRAFNQKFLVFLVRFMIFFPLAFGLFYFIGNIINPFDGGIFQLLSGVPLWLAGIHLFTFATTETLVFQGYLDEKIGRPASALLAGFFHVFIWGGPILYVTISAGALFALFTIVNIMFRKNKDDFTPAIATHTGFNIWKLGTMFV